MDAYQEQEDGNEEGGESEAAFDEIPRCIGTHAATSVAELLMLIQDLTLTRRLNHALISCSRGEIGDECQCEIACYEEQ